MKFTEILEESFLVLRANRMRTALSALGIIIGIASVITLMTLGQASQKSIQQQIESLGSNLLIIRPGNQQQGFLRTSEGNTSLKLADATAIAQSNRITTIESVAADYSSRAQLSYGRENVSINITATTANYFNIRNIEVETGSELSEENITNFEKVVVLGPTTVEDLFGSTAYNPIGQSIRINGTSFRVIGVTKSKGSSGMGNADEVAYIPITTAQKTLFGGDNVSTIYIKAKSASDMEAAQNQLGFFLLERHNKITVDDADFSIQSQADLLNTINQVTKTFTSLLTGIAAISLVVGGIGVMNIMLVTVTERTSEIGLRKALGAKRKTVVTQFLVESIVLTIVGGIIGVTLGVGISAVVTKVMSLPFTLSVQSIALAVAVSCIIGIIFGWYPAQKASKLQPIEALRYE